MSTKKTTKKSTMVQGKGKHSNNVKSVSQGVQTSIELTPVQKSTNYLFQTRQFDNSNKKIAGEFHSTQSTDSNTGLNKADVSFESNSLYLGSFQGPSYYSRNIPEPNIRSEITKKKICKLESYLSLCEDFYLGNISRTRTVSDIFQSLILSHNIDPEVQKDALKKRQFFYCNQNTKSNVKINLKNPQHTEPITNAESIISPLDLLTHPFRNKDVIDLWGPHEVVLFECAVCKYGKEFDKIQRIIKTKTTKEIVDFYYSIWKRTNRYKAWKNNRELSDYIFS
ncbi:putative Myb-like DNA-binding domain protein [Cryptosporidium felis]|nr:putative Myb-like DNA-binding domain protein [Cryptosporidium felis]